MTIVKYCENLAMLCFLVKYAKWLLSSTGWDGENAVNVFKRDERNAW